MPIQGHAVRQDHAGHDHAGGYGCGCHEHGDDGPQSQKSQQQTAPEKELEGQQTSSWPLFVDPLLQS